MSETQTANPEHRIMTFGTHAGKAIQDVPEAWLLWLARSAYRKPYRTMATDELLRRCRTESAAAPSAAVLKLAARYASATADRNEAEREELRRASEARTIREQLDALMAGPLDGNEAGVAMSRPEGGGRAATLRAYEGTIEDVAAAVKRSMDASRETLCGGDVRMAERIASVAALGTGGIRVVTRAAAWAGE